MNVEQYIETAKLYEIYKSLFNLNQRDIFELFLYKNLQFNEIAEIKNVTRQAIYKQIKSCMQKLQKLEQNFQFFKKIKKISIFVYQLESLQGEVMKNIDLLHIEKQTIDFNNKMKRNFQNLVNSKKVLNKMEFIINEIKKEIN